MSEKTFRQAINEAISQEMERDENVIVIGEDVAGGAGANGEQDAWGGPMGTTKGLLPKFGRERITHRIKSRIIKPKYVCRYENQTPSTDN